MNISHFKKSFNILNTILKTKKFNKMLQLIKLKCLYTNGRIIAFISNFLHIFLSVYSYLIIMKSSL